MDIVHITNKGKIMDILERYHIYKQTKYNNQINDKLTVKPNAIFETLIYEAPIEDNQTHSNKTTKTQSSCVEAFTPAGSESYIKTKAVHHYTQDQQPPARKNL